MNKEFEPLSVGDENGEIINKLKTELIPKWSTRFARGSVRQDAIDLVLDDLLEILNSMDK